MKLPKWQAHRGFWADGAKENTREAFLQAKKRGALMVECDVRLSLDAQVVVFHDWDMGRMLGESRACEQMHSEELAEKLVIPLLKDLLLDEETPEFFNIEIKSRQFFDSSLENNLAKLVSQCGSLKKILFSSFNPFSLMKMKKRLPDIPRGLIATNDESDPANHFLLQKMLFLKLADPQFVHLHQDMISPPVVTKFNKKGIGVCAWTIKSLEQGRKLLDMGVVSLISDVDLSSL